MNQMLGAQISKTHMILHGGSGPYSNQHIRYVYYVRADRSQYIANFHLYLNVPPGILASWEKRLGIHLNQTYFNPPELKLLVWDICGDL